MANLRPKRVAIVAGSTLTWRERVMRGISTYAHDRGGWHVYAGPEGEEDAFIFSRGNVWDGVIVRPTPGPILRRVLRLGVPTVAIGSVRFRAPIPRVRIDDAELGRIAARHLIACGLRRFAYCGPFAREAEERGPAFARFLADLGFGCDFSADHPGTLPPTLPWQARRRALAKWIRTLEYPVGVFAWNADQACELVEVCFRAGVQVPNEVAILASGDETVKCEMISPTVTAVDFPATGIGFAAAGVLDKLMAGEPPPSDDVIVPMPGGLIVRESTATVAPADREVHAVSQYIREHVGDALNVVDLAQRMNVSRSWLERHFRRVLGHSPQEAIRLARLSLARKLLVETDLSAAKVAARCGFSTASHFTAAFREATGTTPVAYRHQQRPGG